MLSRQLPVRAGIAQAKIGLVLFVLIGIRWSSDGTSRLLYIYYSRINMIYADNIQGEVNMVTRFSSYVLGFRYFGLRQVFSACRPDL